MAKLRELLVRDQQRKRAFGPGAINCSRNSERNQQGRNQHISVKSNARELRFAIPRVASGLVTHFAERGVNFGLDFILIGVPVACVNVFYSAMKDLDEHCLLDEL